MVNTEAEEKDSFRNCTLQSSDYIALGDGWGEVGEHLLLGLGVICISIPVYLIFICFEQRSSQSSLISPPPSLLSLVSGRRDKWLNKEKGNSAFHYIVFQRMLLFLSLISLVISAVSLLINTISGAQFDDKSYFACTTINNLAAISDFHWFNVIVSFLLPWLVVVVANRFMVLLSMIPHPSQEDSYTLVIEGLDPNTFSDSAIEEYFSITYPRFSLRKITRGKDTRLLRRQLGRLEWNTAVIEQLLSLKDMMEEKTCCGKDWSLAAFGRKQLKLSQKIEAEQKKLKSITGSVRIVFLSFESSYQAQKIVMMEQLDPFSNYCTIEQAPWPEDIAWENMRSPVLSLFIIVFSTFTLFLVSAFAASPSAGAGISRRILTNSFEKLFKIEVIANVLPVSLFMLFSLLMPYIVKLALVRFGHWSKIKIINNFMVGLFFWLLLTTVFFPALMLSNIFDVFKLISALELFKHFYEYNEEDDSFKERLICLSIPSSGAFFVNYLVVSALIKTQAQLHRLGDHMYELWLVIINSCSRAERRVANIYARDYCRKRNTGDNVSLAQDYVSCNVYFAIVMCYSTICPMVSPVFLLFMLIKHLVDLQNLRVCYSANISEPLLIRTAVQLVIFCPLLGQLTTTVHHLTLPGGRDVVGLVAGSLLLLNIFLFMVLQSTGWKFPISVFQEKDNKIGTARSRQIGGRVQEYVDPVLG